MSTNKIKFHFSTGNKTAISTYYIWIHCTFHSSCSSVLKQFEINSIDPCKAEPTWGWPPIITNSLPCCLNFSRKRKQEHLRRHLNELYLLAEKAAIFLTPLLLDLHSDSGNLFICCHLERRHTWWRFSEVHEVAWKQWNIPYRPQCM